MFDYTHINEKLTNLKNNYDSDIGKFKKFSPLGNIEFKTNPFDFEIKLKEPESNTTHTNKSIKQLLKLIHPDKIMLVFSPEFESNPDLDKLVKCSNKIIQENMEFIQAINLLHKNISTNLFTRICSKIELKDQELDKILQINLDESIDSHFDKDFLDLVEKYNSIRSKTIYNYIYGKVMILFSNFNSDLNDLLSQISKKIELFDSWLLNPEEKQMVREEFSVESMIENKEIQIKDLVDLYPKSNLYQTFQMIKENIKNLSFDDLKIKIVKYMYVNLNIYDLSKPCAKQLYTEFKNSI